MTFSRPQMSEPAAVAPTPPPSTGWPIIAEKPVPKTPSPTQVLPEGGIVASSGTTVTATVGGKAEERQEDDDEWDEEEEETPEARQHNWMEAFIKRHSPSHPHEYVQTFQMIRMDQEQMRSRPACSIATAASPAHYMRNRYRDILPYDTTRVRLEASGPVDGNADGYVNASHITLKHGRTRFIAAQAPLSQTLDEFWAMVDEQGVCLIVMLCKLVEMAKIKCERYWPEAKGGREIFGAYEIEFVDEEKFADDDDYILRTLRMRREDGETRTIHQLHYKEWPDHGCPSGTAQLLRMIERMAELAAGPPPAPTFAPTNPFASPKKLPSTNPFAVDVAAEAAKKTLPSLPPASAAEVEPEAAARPPVLVHCSAGVGRTGTIIAVNYVRELMAQNVNSFIHLCTDLDMKELVLRLRLQRSSMVQTPDQFHFVHRCVAAYCRQALGYPDIEPPSSLDDLPSPPKRPELVSNGSIVGLIPPATPVLQPDGTFAPALIDVNSSDDEGATSVPDYPEEPRAPRGPEDINGAV